MLQCAHIVFFKKDQNILVYTISRLNVKIVPISKEFQYEHQILTLY